MDTCDSRSTEVLFIGGRSGVGKTSVTNRIHHELSEAFVRHAVIDGDGLDMAFPPPWEHALAEQNFAAVWANYRALNYRRLIYTNTASVSADEMKTLTAAMGDHPVAHGVLLRCSDESARQRLARREDGTVLDQHVHRSAVMAVQLDRGAPDWVHRIDTDSGSINEIARQILDLVEWAAERPCGGVV